ncbi:hypothetical protein BJ546DRAFT_253044 [Cryomyces antarcticus]
MPARDVRDEDPAKTERRRKKDYDRDRDTTKPRDKDRRHKSERSSRLRKRTSSSRERDRESRRDRAALSDSHSRSDRKVTMVVPEMERRASPTSPGEPKTNTAYPSFSKAHSRESVGSRDSAHPRVSMYTPEPTDLGRDSLDKNRNVSPRPNAPTRAAPPSPPLTAEEPELKRTGSGNSMRHNVKCVHEEVSNGRRSVDNGPRGAERPNFSASRSSLRNTAKADDESEVSEATESYKSSTTLQDSAQSITDSEATSVAPDRKTSRRPPALVSNHDSSPASYPSSSPRTPNLQEANFPPIEQDRKSTPAIEIGANDGSRPHSVGPTPPLPFGAPPPPPPPPPMMMPADVPRVDYLLQNGGLTHLVPKSLLAAAVQPSPVQPYQQYASPRAPQGPPNFDVQKIFTPLHNLMDDYCRVIAKNGSVAVATGYRSVARRLLDRLEQVFARNISSETCTCIMCKSFPQSQVRDEEGTGVSWGEILEFVSGRRELPQWPPFSITTNSACLGISGFEQKAPMQRLDVDVPDEYRDHYMRQNKKTKLAVQNWLASQPELPSSPPQEVDDDTLSFAILTHLEPEQRKLYNALMRGMSTLPQSRVPTPLEKPARSDLLVKIGQALQRLYRLAGPPRDPECTIYLLQNPHLHNVLATLAAVSAGEWEILVSGRFDGFLWSGAEQRFPPSASAFNSPAASRGPSRGPAATPLSRTTTPFGAAGAPSRDTTPFSPFRANPAMFPPSRGPTPFQNNNSSAATPASAPGGPVQLDEETEIAVLAEVEREIYAGMEALEDAFEALHCKAETVRRALRERSAGLAIAAQARRGSAADDIGVRMGTPASGWNGIGGWESETDDGIDEARSEIAPDDSASNISYNRRRRPERRHERWTPAPVEEEDEGSVAGGDHRRRR